MGSTAWKNRQGLIIALIGRDNGCWMLEDCNDVGFSQYLVLLSDFSKTILRVASCGFVCVGRVEFERG